MTQIEAQNRKGYNEVLLLCTVLVLITAYGFYENFSLIKHQIQYANKWDMQSFALVADFPISLLLVYFLYKGQKIAWVLFVITYAFIVLRTTNDFIFELQLPKQSTDDSMLGQLLDIMDPRMGPIYYLTIIVLYGALVMFGMRDKVLYYFSIEKNHKIIAIATPILLAIFYWYRSI